MVNYVADFFITCPKCGDQFPVKATPEAVRGIAEDTLFMFCPDHSKSPYYRSLVIPQNWLKRSNA